MAEVKSHHAKGSIENVLNYPIGYGPSDLKSEECQFGYLGPFKIAAEIQDGCKSRGNLLFFFFIVFFKEKFLCTLVSETQIFYVQK